MAGAVTFSDPLVVPPVLVPPGDTVATIPVVAAPILGCAPPVSRSAADIVSDGGCKFGAPLLAAEYNSAVGPLFIIHIGFLNRLVCGLGAFCSAVIHATAVGSGCGIGAPNDFSLSLASYTMLESG